MMAGDNGIYQYQPNKPICIVAAILFGASAAFHTFKMLRTKTWFHTSLVVGSWMMTIGYVARYFSASNPSSLMPYIFQSLFIILPPSLYAATIYMIYKRLCIFVQTPSASIIRPELTTRIFVSGDIFAFFLQSGGGGMMATPSMTSLGEKIMLVGLAIQLLFFMLFLCLSLVFLHRMRSSPTWYTTPTYGRWSWKTLLYWLFTAAAVIIARCVFRILEFAQGHDGYLISKEVFLYLFDAAPMLAVQIGFSVIYAGDVLPARGEGMGKLSGGDSASDVEIGLRERS